MDREQAVLDVAIVGAGIAGVVALYYARQAGLQARVFERQDGVGGLWRKLPAWQDIQIAPADWAIGDLALAGPYQPAVLANIQSWVDRFGLADGISLATEVHSARHEGGVWRLATSKGYFEARHLACATGAHNIPHVPEVSRIAPDVRELHSSALRDPAEVAGKSVLVVGGGGSAFDLLDLCFEHGAARIAWAYRGLHWFTPTRKIKHVAGSVREFARLQVSGMTLEQQSAVIAEDLRGRYAKFGLESIQPAKPFDLRHDQLIPGRHRMVENFAAIERHAATVERIEGRKLTLSDGAELEPDLLLWGTGYAVDLSFLEVQPLRTLRVLGDVAARCGGAFRSLDAPNLHILGIGLDGIGSAPFAYSLMGRSLAAHIAGRADLGLEPVPHRLNHFELANYLAPRDPHNYPPSNWRQALRELALNTPDSQPYPIP
ncbi:hypothetical protein GCM10027034_17080 [Ramlibacter solisilvae]|uniref:NAD(P)/FAD-dependent oxidoreductase n=1 Tax=Ramlibacter tataouinensis TaxID=94132 RepID=A0A127JVT8_9BURK|nr:NAD(P)/FAD-dependent oxidoreductase [Ramlibacter tataouinensis]AMO24126.1 hypothetical protein UC35_16345 [Ramlibacter tataouinensis]